MIHLEDQGFLALASYQAKLTMAEGIVLGTGAAIALTAAHFASKSLAEERRRPSMPSIFSKPGTRSIEKVVQAIESNPEISAILNKYDDVLTLAYMTKKDKRNRLEKYAKFIASTDLDERGLAALLKGGFKDFIIESTMEEGGPKDMQRVAEIAKRPLDQIVWMREEARRLNPYTRYSSNVYDFFQDFSEIEPEKFEDAKVIYGVVSNVTPSNLASPSLPTVRFLRGGFRPMDVAKLGRAASSMSVNWDRPEIGQAAREIIAKYDSNEIEAIGRYLKSDKDVLNFLDLGLESIPDAKYELYPIKTYSESYDAPQYEWSKYAEDVKELQTAPSDYFASANIHPADHLAFWRAGKKSGEVRNAVRALKAASEAISSSSGRQMIQYLAKRLGANLGDKSDPETKSYQISKLKNLAKAVKSGLLQKLDKTIIEHDLEMGGSGDAFLTTTYEDKFLDFIENVDKIKDWKSYGDLSEQLAVATNVYASRPSVGLSEEQKILRRSRDRLARRDPDWAISEFPAEYRRGRRIARFLDELTDHVVGLVDAGETIVIHGRDGELLYDLLRRRLGPRDMSRVRYVLTSRPMTTQAMTIPEVYKDYLGRMVPKNAIHIDTGFAGSIPRWFDQQGYQVKAIQMVSATRPEEQIPVSMSISDDERREIVLSDLEHSSQRIEQPTQYVPATADEPERGGFRGLVYSWAAPGFHARAYGVYDALGIPRLTQKTPKTRFEEKQTFRVAVEEPAADEDVEETATLKVLK